VGKNNGIITYFGGYRWQLRVPLLCSAGEPWGFFVQTLAEVKSRLVDGFLGRLGPKIQVIARSAALETLERITCEIRRERAMFSVLGSFVKRTWAPDLIARPSENVNPQQLQDFGHRYVSPKLAKIDPWHGLPRTATEKRNPYFTVLLAIGALIDNAQFRTS
jgi:hypothetical protein